ncbi:MAG: amidohydrolase family protein, partial [Candidatus Korarchaeota archaeon]|nr:amidohydrolase family protein [Candidatus Korarchaeota archaeon]
SGAGLQLAVHAIGDRANDMVLRIYSELGREAVRGLRHRIEHASVLRPDQLRLMAELGAAAAVQPHFIISDWWVVRRLGRRRAAWAYPLRTMATAGIPMGFSTDAPVEPLDPWETIYAAVTRGEYEGVELAAETPGERLGLEESLHYYTMGSAYLVFEEERLGSLVPGKLADYIVVDRDPLVMEPPEIRGVKVLETVVGGEIVYRAAS